MEVNVKKLMILKLCSPHVNLLLEVKQLFRYMEEMSYAEYFALDPTQVPRERRMSHLASQDFDMPAASFGSVSAARAIGCFAADLRYEDVPPRVLEFAREHILDTVGRHLAGCNAL